MSLPTSYLTSGKNLRGIFDAISQAQAPKTFSISFLASLGFKGTQDRLVIGVLKALGFLDGSGAPTQRYFEYLDRSRSAKVLAEGIRSAYADLFQINKDAQSLSQTDVKNKLRTLSQGKLSDSVLDKHAYTFKALCTLAKFDAGPSQKEDTTLGKDDEPEEKDSKVGAKLSLGGLVYNIQIVLPESRDRAVYDALFKSLKDHLL